MISVVQPIHEQMALINRFFSVIQSHTASVVQPIIKWITVMNFFLFLFLWSKTIQRVSGLKLIPKLMTLTWFLLVIQICTVQFKTIKWMTLINRFFLVILSDLYSNSFLKWLLSSGYSYEPVLFSNWNQFN